LRQRHVAAVLLVERGDQGLAVGGVDGGGLQGGGRRQVRGQALGAAGKPGGVAERQHARGEGPRDQQGTDDGTEQQLCQVAGGRVHTDLLTGRLHTPSPE